MIANVIVNAAEATPPTGTITIGARANGDCATLTVADDGPGVPPESSKVVYRIVSMPDRDS